MNRLFSRGKSNACRDNSAELIAALERMAEAGNEVTRLISERPPCPEGMTPCLACRQFVAAALHHPMSAPLRTFAKTGATTGAKRRKRR